MWSFIFIKISSTGSSNSNFRDVNHRKMPVLQPMERGDSKELSDMRSSKETLKRTAEPLPSERERRGGPWCAECLGDPGPARAWGVGGLGGTAGLWKCLEEGEGCGFWGRRGGSLNPHTHTYACSDVPGPLGAAWAMNPFLCPTSSSVKPLCLLHTRHLSGFSGDS